MDKGVAIERCIVLLGLKHSGKSSVGRLLAPGLHRRHYDADRLLEEHYFTLYRKRLGLRAIYTELGKSDFDRLQLKVLQDFLERGPGTTDLAPPILSLGGGAGDLAELGQLLYDKNCFVILLDEQPSLLFQRILRSGLPPFLGNTATPQEAFSRFYKISGPRLRRYRLWSDLVCRCDQRSQEVIARELQDQLWIEA